VAAKCCYAVLLMLVSFYFIRSSEAVEGSCRIFALPVLENHPPKHGQKLRFMPLASVKVALVVSSYCVKLNQCFTSCPGSSLGSSARAPLLECGAQVLLAAAFISDRRNGRSRQEPITPAGESTTLALRKEGGAGRGRVPIVRFADMLPLGGPGAR
jgi:hypothetical protein